MISHFGAPWFPNELKPKCLECDNVKDTVHNVIALSLTAKVFQEIIGSSTFFKDFIELIHPKYARSVLTKESQAEIGQGASNKENTSFMRKYFNFRNLLIQKDEVFEGIAFGDALVSEDGVEVFSFQNGIISSTLKDNSPTLVIDIPKNLQIPSPKKQELLRAARLEKFLIIGYDSTVYIYKRDDENFLVKHEMTGEICQLITLKKDLLCVVIKQADGSCSLATFDLKIPEQQNLEILLPKSTGVFPHPHPICFSEEYLIHIQILNDKSIMYALPLSSLTEAPTNNTSSPWITQTADLSTRYLLPNGNHFIEVVCKGSHICDIFKITITEKRFEATEIAKDIIVSNNEYDHLQDVCIQDDRIYFEFETRVFLQGNIARKYLAKNVFSYDIILNKTNELFSIQLEDHNLFDSRFLKSATTIYYLVSVEKIIFMGQGIRQSYLTTLTFGKV